MNTTVTLVINASIVGAAGPGHPGPNTPDHA